MGALSLSLCLLSFALILILFSDNILVLPWINWWCPICLEYCCLEKREGLLLPLLSFERGHRLFFSCVGVDAHMLPCPKNLHESEHEIRIKMLVLPLFYWGSSTIFYLCCFFFDSLVLPRFLPRITGAQFMILLPSVDMISSILFKSCLGLIRCLRFMSCLRLICCL